MESLLFLRLSNPVSKSRLLENLEQSFLAFLKIDSFLFCYVVCRDVTQVGALVYVTELLEEGEEFGFADARV